MPTATGECFRSTSAGEEQTAILVTVDRYKLEFIGRAQRLDLLSLCKENDSKIEVAGGSMQGCEVGSPALALRFVAAAVCVDNRLLRNGDCLSDTSEREKRVREIAAGTRSVPPVFLGHIRFQARPARFDRVCSIGPGPAGRMPCSQATTRGRWP